MKVAKRLIDYDPVTGISTYHEYNPLNDSTTISHEADATPIIERNKALATDDDHTKLGIKQEFWHYASIPAGVIMEWKQKFGVDVWNKNHSKRVGQLLNDPDYRYLKVTSGYHQMKG